MFGRENARGEGGANSKIKVGRPKKKSGWVTVSTLQKVGRGAVVVRDVICKAR